MKVGLNLVYLVPGETGGMEVFARELIPALVAARPDLDLVAFVNREAADAGGGPWGELIPAVTVPVHARRRTEWVRGEQTLLPRLAAREGVDLVHSLASTAPMWGRFRRVVTIHDLIYRVYPEAHSGVLTQGMRVLVRGAAMRSRRVMADSASTRDDLVRYLKVPESKIDVVALGVGNVARTEPMDEAALRSSLSLGDRALILSVSAKRPHKNLLRLIEALATVEVAERPVVVLPGYATWHEKDLRERAATLGVADDVRFLDWVPAAELEGLYAAASGFVFPSLYEGFGLPVLEAMARGVPVACSDRSSLPEVVGDAAVMFNPERVDEIAAAMRRLAGDEALRDRLRAAGRVQAARFTWERTARAVLASYERAMKG